jgi:flagellar biosynthesis component FlhA
MKDEISIKELSSIIEYVSLNLERKYEGVWSYNMEDLDKKIKEEIQQGELYIKSLESSIDNSFLSQINNDELKKFGCSVDEYKRSVEKDIENSKEKMRILKQTLKDIESEKVSRLNKKVDRCMEL